MVVGFGCMWGTVIVGFKGRVWWCWVDGQGCASEEPNLMFCYKFIMFILCSFEFLFLLMGISIVFLSYFKGY